MKKNQEQFPLRLQRALAAAGLDRYDGARVLAASLSTVEKWLSGAVTPHELTQEGALRRLEKEDEALSVVHTLERLEDARESVGCAIRVAKDLQKKANGRAKR